MTATPKQPRPWQLLRPVGWSAPLALLAATVALHLPATFEAYGRADDYYALRESLTFGLQEFWDTNSAGGRLIPAVFGSLTFAMVDSVEGLAWLRALAVLAVATAGALVAAWGIRRASGADLRRVGGPLVAGALLVAVPGAQTVVTWAVLGIPAWSLVLALLGGIVIDSWRPRGGRPLAYVAGGVLVLASAFTYQQFATLALLPPVLGAALDFARGRGLRWGAVVVSTTAVGGSLALNYASVLAFGGSLSSRVTDRPGLSDTAEWFLQSYLPRTVDLDVPNHTGSTVAWSVVVGLVLLVPAIRGVRWLALSGAVLLCWLGAALPMAFVGELWASYRVTYPPQIALWSGAFLAAGWALSDRPREVRLGVRQGVACAAVVISLAVLSLGATRAYFYYAAPNGNDWRSAQCVVEETPDLGRPGDVLVTQPYSAGRSPVVVGDEAGVISASIGWAVTDLLWLAAVEQGEDPRFRAGSMPVISDTAPRQGGSRFVTVAQDACETP